ncbi:hypothetical protein SGRA_3459 [Saprospira grandis str. Lewin]|uniref:Uncharacterized protein n=1 Tax=Saprospira grandis (strain Lewin) TaxID=984262 RepID=H6L1V6_SAPGL|nr:hypothetical protein SGRA_3459 [Saprospira grandis str. Lewin]
MGEVVILGPAAGSASPRLAAAMLRGSQVCSALQATLRFAFGLAYGHPCAALGRSAVFFLLGVLLRRFGAVLG